MGRRKFILDTGGYCFLCLRRGNWSHNGQNVSKATSLRNIICQYLKVDLKTALSVDSVLKSDMAMAESELMGSLCPKCAQLSERFSAHFLEMEEIRLKLQFCLKAIYDRMAEVDKGHHGGLLEEFRREMLSKPETYCQLGVVEHLRKKTLEGCSRKLITVVPRVKIEKLSDPVILVATGIKAEDRSAPKEKMFVGGTNEDNLPQSRTTSIDEEVNPASFVNCDMIMTDEEEEAVEKLILGSGLTLSPTLHPPKNLTQVHGDHNNELQCQLCGKVFSKKENLKVHFKTIHFQLREFGCDQCESRFTQKAHLVKHQQARHSARISKNYQVGPSSSSPAKQKLRKERSILPSPPKAKSKSSKNADGSKKSKLGRPKSLIAKSGKDRLALNPRMKTSYRCTMCDKGFTSEKNLKRHFKVVHLKSRKLSCGQCGKDFTSSSNLQIHIKTVHFELRPFRCDFCDQRFKQKAHLERHVSFRHKHQKNATSQKLEEAPSPSFGVAVGFKVPPTIDVSEHVQSTPFHKNELPYYNWVRGMEEGDDEGECEIITGDPKQETLTFQNDTLNLD